MYLLLFLNGILFMLLLKAIFLTKLFIFFLFIFNSIPNHFTILFFTVYLESRRDKITDFRNNSLFLRNLGFWFNLLNFATIT